MRKEKFHNEFVIMQNPSHSPSTPAEPGTVLKYKGKGENNHILMRKIRRNIKVTKQCCYTWCNGAAWRVSAPVLWRKPKTPIWRCWYKSWSISVKQKRGDYSWNHESGGTAKCPLINSFNFKWMTKAIANKQRTSCDTA